MPTTSLLEAFEHLSARKRAGENFSPEDRVRWKRVRGELEEVLFQKPADPDADRREHLRVPVAMRVRYWSRDELKDRYVRVLGEGGLFVATDEQLPVGASVELEIEVVQRGLQLKVQGVVASVHREDDPAQCGMGVRFVDLTWEHKTVLYDLVDDSLRQGLLERRRYTRLDSRLQARFLWSEGSFVLPTADLSPDGLFVATEHLMMPGERAKVLLLVPGREDPVRVISEVIRVVETPLPGLSTGLGLRFVMIDRQGRRAILDYMVARVLNRFGPIDPRSEARAQPRLKRRIPVDYTVADHLSQTYTRDLSGGGIFLQSFEPPAVGSQVEVVLQHPEDERRLPLGGRVVRVVAPDPLRPHRVPGAGVRYSALSQGQRERLSEFMREFILLESEPISL